MPRLLEALALETLPVQAFFLTCLLSGCRGREARAMRWAYLNLIQAVWTMPTSKNGKSHKVPLPPALVAMLCTFPQTEEFVFASPRHNAGPVKKSTSFYTWRKIRARAGLGDVTIHDLRRTCASWMACNGENLAVISRVLNHTSLAITSVYARLDVTSMKSALGKNADRLLGMSLAPVAEADPSALPVTTSAPPDLPRPQPIVRTPSREEERDEWPG